jgi:hypothetical protein
MKTWIGATTLLALVAVADIGAIDNAAAAKIITVPQFRAAHAADTDVQPRLRRGTRSDRYADRGYDRPYDGGWTYYYGRPYYYAPAPFPFGFDFGFGW